LSKYKSLDKQFYRSFLGIETGFGVATKLPIAPFYRSFLGIETNILKMSVNFDT